MEFRTKETFDKPPRFHLLPTACFINTKKEWERERKSKIKTNIKRKTKLEKQNKKRQKQNNARLKKNLLPDARWMSWSSFNKYIEAKEIMKFG